MPSTDLGACEWFVWDLRRSNLIDRGQLDQVVGEYLKRHPRAEPPALAEHLVGQSILTQFQADRILQGKTQGLVLGPYTLTDSIGTGSMGTVYKALSKNDNKWYAVKVLPRRSMWNVRLARRQVRSFEQLNHPTVVPFVDVGTSGGLHYLSWPLVEGESFESVMQRQGKIAPDVAALYALQIAQGLNVCHQNGIFHGLLKPSNMMLASDGNLRILDYGIGSLLAENEGESLVDTMSTANTLTSGLDCSSPESIMEPTNRTAAGDQYSLGCILYYFISGRYPFPEGSAVEKMMAHQYKQPTPLRELAPHTPPELEAVVERLMQKTPEARYSSCEEVIEALRPLAASTAPALPTKKAAPVKSGGSKMGTDPNGQSGERAPAAKSAGGGKSVASPAAKSAGGGSDKGGGMRENFGLKGGAAAPPAPKRELPPEPEDEEEEIEEEEDEDEDEDEEDDEDSEGGRIGTILLIVGALVVCGVAFWLSMRYLK